VPAPTQTTADRVRKRYGRRGRWVLDGVDLTVPAGAVTVVAGGNGSGKTTLLQVLAGASLPTAGRVHGRPPAVAYVPERLPAHGPMTAAEYLGHLGRIRRLPADTVRTRSAELFDLLALAPGPDVPVASLSKGNAQKVALAQAFLAPVGLLLLDEPQAGLDQPARRALGDLVRQACRRGAAVVVSAHRPDAALAGLAAGAADNAAAGAAYAAGAAGAADNIGAAYELAGGRLRPVAVPVERGPGLYLLLEAVAAGASVQDLAADPRVRVLEHRPPYCRVAAAAGHADAVLLAALAAGWSLREAGPP
jgi:ABC-type Mn2+/Zn2+ transport system ATPase subunit